MLNGEKKKKKKKKKRCALYKAKDHDDNDHSNHLLESFLCCSDVTGAPDDGARNWLGLREEGSFVRGGKRLEVEYID